MNKPLISVIICTYNRKQYIVETIESVLNQKYQPIEIIVVDDGSTDNTGELLSSYGNKIRYHRHDNQGITITRNTGCQLAKGEFIVFQDDDDPMPENKISLLYDAFCMSDDIVLSVGDLAIIDNNGKKTGERWLPKNSSLISPIIMEDAFEAILWPKVGATPNTTLFRKQDGQKINWFDESFVYGSEDKDFYARLALLGSLVYVPEVVTYYRRGHESMTRKPFLIAFTQVELFAKHLNNTNPTNIRLIKRLQQRILTALKQMAKYKSNRINLKNSDYNACIRQGLGCLPLNSKLEYYLYKWIKLPVRKLVKKT